MGEINVVPYIDVMLVLLIIFMITAPLLTQGIKVNLPKAAAEPLPFQRNQDPLVLSVDARGQLYMNVGSRPREPIDDETALVRATVALRREPGRPVLVNADQSVNYGRVVQAMALLQQAGATEIGFQTQSPARAAPSTARPAAANAEPSPVSSGEAGVAPSGEPSAASVASAAPAAPAAPSSASVAPAVAPAAAPAVVPASPSAGAEAAH
ncbi:MAG TPA: protein TolR [Steroidobacteraceae bacterium]|nr:protein TolR [Steroidobacteraceae bacterium]